MEYSYLNQGGFDGNCSLGGMGDPSAGLASCNLPGSYADLSRCSVANQTQAAAAAYGTYSSMRPTFNAMGSVGPAAPTSCSMMPRPPHTRDPHMAPQPPMFHTGEFISITEIFPDLAIFYAKASKKQWGKEGKIK
jgi:hypothetical protein